MNSTRRPPLATRDSTWVRMCLTWLAYTITGVLSVALASTAEQVAPFYLASGVGLACVLTWGPRMLLAVGLGSAAVEAYARWAAVPSTLDLMSAVPISVTGVGAALQAGLALWLARRLTTDSLPLEQPREIGLFLLLTGPMACLVNASLTITSLVLIGELPDTRALDTFLDWWMGDTIGVLLGTPLMLTLIGQPAESWARRRRTVGIPLLIMAIVVMGVARQVQVWTSERSEHLFQRDIDGLQHAAHLTLSSYQNVLEALHGLYQASEVVDRKEFQTASGYWLATVRGLGGIGWDERLRTDDLPAFEARQRAAGFAGYKVFDTRDRVPPKGDELVAVTYVEPLGPNERALGYNVLSEPATREAFERARREDKIVATTALPIGPDGQDQAGVVAYRAVYKGLHGTPLERVQATQGAVFLLVKMEDMLRTMLADMPAHLRACLMDTTGGGRETYLAGTPTCRDERPWLNHPQHWQLPLQFAERRWALMVWSPDEHPAIASDHMPRLIGAGGMALTAALGALLLVMTGHARRIEAAMQEARAQKLAADAANQAKSDFLSRMSHELRTPLNAVLGFAQVLEMDVQEPLGPTQHQRVQQIQQAGWHLLAMIDDVLDISRVDTGNLQLDIRPTPLREPIQAALDMVSSEALKHQVTLSPAPEVPADWWVSVDATRLQQVLVNLLTNAIKYNRPGGRARLTVELLPRQGRIGERLMVSVEDTGMGMSESQLTQLFQPFNRLGREHSGIDGTGIGLVITRHLVLAMNGVLQVRSQPDQGSVFSVTLPRVTMPEGEAHKPAAPRATPAPAPAPMPSPAPAPSSVAPEHAAAPPQRRVLYVEDNAANSAVIQSALASRSWLQLTVAPTIEEGLSVLHDRVRGRRPDLILLDVHLPDASGLELLHLLKANPDTADIPVIMISADAMPEQIDAALAAGAACYLTKPVQIAALLVQVDDLLKGPRS